MTDAEIFTLVDHLERCLLPKENFHHRDHLTVAVVYLYASNFEAAVSRMRETLKRFCRASSGQRAVSRNIDPVLATADRFTA